MVNITTPLAALISFYLIIFGVILLVLEVGDPSFTHGSRVPPAVDAQRVAFQEALDSEAHFLTNNAGRGLFYLFVGSISCALTPSGAAGLIAGIVFMIHGVVVLYIEGNARFVAWRSGSEEEAGRTAVDSSNAALKAAVPPASTSGTEHTPASDSGASGAASEEAVSGAEPGSGDGPGSSGGEATV